MILSSSLIILTTISTISLTQSLGNHEDGHFKSNLSLAYMKRLFSRCSVRRNKSWKVSRGRKNTHQRVLAEGIDPISTYVHPRTAEFHWRITTHNLSMGLLSKDIFTPYRSKKQNRRTVKNAKFVFTVKDIKSDQFNQQLPLVQLQKRITFQGGLNISKWKHIRTFRLSASRNFHFVVVGVKSMVRHYLKLVEAARLDGSKRENPQLQIRLKVKSKSNDISIDRLFHLSKEDGKHRPFLLLQYENCDTKKKRKKQDTPKLIEADTVQKRHAVGSARNALSTRKNPTSPAQNNNSGDQRCHIADHFIDFREGKLADRLFSSRVLHPSRLNIRACNGNCFCRDGSCHAEGTGIDITNHARFKGLIGASRRGNQKLWMEKGQYIPDIKTQCVPISYKPQQLYILNDEGVPTIIILNDLVASKCGCR